MQPLVTCTCHNEVSDATYATIGWIELSKGYEWLEATEVKMAIGMLLIAELIADKAPARPSVNVSSNLGMGCVHRDEESPPYATGCHRHCSELQACSPSSHFRFRLWTRFSI